VYLSAALLSVFSANASSESVDLSFQSKSVLIERIPEFNSLKNFLVDLAGVSERLKKEKEFIGVARIIIAVRMDGNLRFWRVSPDGKTEEETSKIVTSAFAKTTVPKVKVGHMVFEIPIHGANGGMPNAWKDYLTANPPRKGCNPADDILVRVWPDSTLTGIWPGSSIANKCGEMLMTTHSQISKFMRDSYSCDKFAVTDTKLSKEIPEKEALIEEWQADICGNKKVFYTFFVVSREGRMRMFFSTKSL